MSFISLYLFLIFIKNSFDSIIIEKFPKAIILPSGNIFMILESGFYIYNSKFSLNKTIYSFTSDEKIDNDEEYNKIAFSEIELDDNFYIFCLTKDKILFLFENNNYQYNKYILDLTSKGNYYSITPKEYNKTETKILISFASIEFISGSYHFNLNLYVYKLDLSLFNQERNITKYSYKGEKIFQCSSDFLNVKDFYLNCYNKYSSNIFFCIYKKYDCSNNIQMKIESLKCRLNSDYSLSRKGVKDINGKESSKDIKISLSKNGTQSLICYRYMQDNTHCLYYNYISNSFIDISNNLENCSKLETYYFNETNKYIIICNLNKSRNSIDFELIILNDDFTIGNIQGKEKFLITLNECENINRFSLVYSKIDEDYILITDCNNSNTDWHIYFNNIINFNNASIDNSINSTFLSQSINFNYVTDSFFNSDNILYNNYSSLNSSLISSTFITSSSLLNSNSYLNSYSSTILYIIQLFPL